MNKDTYIDFLKELESLLKRTEHSYWEKATGNNLMNSLYGRYWSKGVSLHHLINILEVYKRDHIYEDVIDTFLVQQLHKLRSYTDDPQ